MFRKTIMKAALGRGSRLALLLAKGYYFRNFLSKRPSVHSIAFTERMGM